MNWTQLVLQLGISGLVVFVGYQIAMKLIDKWSTSEAQRTVAIQEGFKADVAAHQEITKTMQVLANQFYRVEGKLDTALDLTPVRAMNRVELTATQNEPSAVERSERMRSPSVIVDDREEYDTPVDRPPDRQTPSPKRASSVAGVYGPYGKPKAGG